MKLTYLHLALLFAATTSSTFAMKRCKLVSFRPFYLKNLAVMRGLLTAHHFSNKSDYADQMVTLKNGAQLKEDKLVNIMQKIVNLATSKQWKNNHALATLIDLRTKKEKPTPTNPFIGHLAKLKLVNKQSEPFKNVQHIIDSAILQENDSLIRSPVKGKYLKKPLVIDNSTDFDPQALWEIQVHEDLNLVIIFHVQANPGIAFPFFQELKLHSEDETEIDNLPYFDRKAEEQLKEIN